MIVSPRMHSFTWMGGAQLNGFAPPSMLMDGGNPACRTYFAIFFISFPADLNSVTNPVKEYGGLTGGLKIVIIMIVFLDADYVTCWDCNA